MTTMSASVRHHIFLCVLLLILLVSSSVSAAQFECLVGTITYPCPDISAQIDEYGVAFRTYAAMGMALIVVQDPPSSETPLTQLRATYPTFQDYFNGTGNKEQKSINRTVPIGVLEDSTSARSRILESISFLPDDVLSSPPTPLNTSLLVLSVPAGSPVMSWAFKAEPTEDEIQLQRGLLDQSLDKHNVKYNPHTWALVIYNLPDNPLKYGWTEIWRFPPTHSPHGTGINHYLRRTAVQSNIKRHTKTQMN